MPRDCTLIDTRRKQSYSVCINRFLFPLALVILVLASFLPATAAGVFYVAPDGDDANPGAFAQPWRTIQHAADTLQPGDTVYVRGGTFNESVLLTRSGAPGNPITFAAYSNETVTLDGGDTLYAGFQTTFSDPDPHVSDIVINGFTIQNFHAFGIVAWSVNDRLTLSNLAIHNNGGAGIRLSNSDGSRVQNVLLQSNEGGFDCTPILPGAESDPGCTNLYIADTRAIDNGTQGDTGTDAFAVEKGDNILIERSLATGGPGDGFDIKGSRATLSRVTAYNTRNNIKLWRGGTIANALAYDAKADANLVLAAGGSYTITNVTIANMTGYAYLATIGDSSAPGSTPVRLHNTIFYNDNPIMGGTLVWFGPSVSLIADNNLYYNPYRTDALICAEFAPYNGLCFSDDEINNHTWLESNGRYANPLFVSPSTKNFHLTGGSPAIDAGAFVTGISTDLDGIPRVGAPDIGAYERWIASAWLYVPLIHK